MDILSAEDVLKKLQEKKYPHQEQYFAMYSSWFGGIIKDSAMMMVPIDDHLVHRGDGIFEALKCINGEFYGLMPHLERLQRSANAVKLKLRFSLEEMRDIVLRTARTVQEDTCFVRIYASRGPGSFGPNPNDSVGSQFYVVITSFNPVAEEKYENGCSMKLSKSIAKEPCFATVKSCNYLQNVLLKMEALENGVDFCIPKASQGNLTEGPTENFVLVTKENELVVPCFEHTLRGITVTRMMDLCKPLVLSGELKAITERLVTEEDVFEAKEVMMVGTTLDALPVVTFEGKDIGDGKVGHFAKLFRSLIVKDQEKGSDFCITK